MQVDGIQASTAPMRYLEIDTIPSSPIGAFQSRLGDVAPFLVRVGIPPGVVATQDKRDSAICAHSNAAE